MKRFILLLSAVIAVASCSLQKAVNTVSDEQLSETYSELRQIYETDLSKKVIMPGEGYLKYPYMIPAGFYKQMWDWDGFFMGIGSTTSEKQFLICNTRIAVEKADAAAVAEARLLYAMAHY